MYSYALSADGALRTQLSLKLHKRSGGVNLFLGIVFIGKIRWLLTIRVIPLGVRIPSIPIYYLAFTHTAL